MDLSISNLIPIDIQKHKEIILISKMEHVNQQTCHLSSKIFSNDELILFACGRQTKFMHPNSRQPLRNVDLEADYV